MENKNNIKVYTVSNGVELNISAPSTKQIITATNNRAQYFAEQALKYRDETKVYCDRAKQYAENNSNVTLNQINILKSSLEEKIAKKQNSGDYALKSDLPTLVSQLENDADYITTQELNTAIEAQELPEREGNAGKFLMTDGENDSWVALSGFSLFDYRVTDKILNYTETKGWALQGSYVYKKATAGSYYGYPDFYNKCLEEYNEATNIETINGIEVKAHTNGHKFYNIVDKNAIDDFYNSMGVAWFYGVDIENERIFLPRNNYFAIQGSANNVPALGNGTTVGLTDGINFGGLFSSSNGGMSGAFQAISSIYGASVSASVTGSGSSVGDIGRQKGLGLTADSAKSGIIVDTSKVLKTDDSKYLYICVGNTTNYEGITDVVNQGVDLLEQVNQGIEGRVKLDGSNANFVYITKTYQDGTSWYRIWSDGWCEQGGTIGAITTVVTLLKAYTSTNYSIMCQKGVGGTKFPTVVTEQTATSFTLDPSYGDSTKTPAWWRACGYIS